MSQIEHMKVKKNKNKYLFFAMIDFSKAYDSIDRKKIIETMKDFNINIRIIEMIIQMYSQDSTTIKLGNMKEKVEVTSGIRQGCCISTLLFKLVTFKIIEVLRNKGRKYKIDKYEGKSLWLADDSTLISSSIEDMEINIKILKDTASTYGLKVNQDKSKVLQVRGTERPRKVGGLEVVDRVKYLGVIVGGTGRDIFKYERESLIEKAQKKAATIKSYIKKSYDITSVGKAVWKLQAIPALMFGKQVVTLSKKN